jgi:IS5 family transposase
MIMSIATTHGSTHDLKLFRDCGVKLPLETALIGDAGYQGIHKYHPHSITPHKSTKLSPLSSVQRLDNRVLARTRQPVEHVIRRLKIFRVLKGIYRHRRRRFNLRSHLLAAISNYNYSLYT